MKNESIIHNFKPNASGSQQLTDTSDPQQQLHTGTTGYQQLTSTSGPQQQLHTGTTGYQQLTGTSRTRLEHVTSILTDIIKARGQEGIYMDSFETDSIRLGFSKFEFSNALKTIKENYDIKEINDQLF